jgi:hypothetical protein
MPITRARPDFTDIVAWGFDGTLTVTVGNKLWSSFRQIELMAWKGLVNTPSVGAAILVDLNTVDPATGVRTSVLASQTDRISIAAGSRINTVTFVPTIIVLAANPLTVDIDQIGSTTAGSDLVVQVRYREVLS